MYRDIHIKTTLLFSVLINETAILIFAFYTADRLYIHTIIFACLKSSCYTEELVLFKKLK